MRLIDAKIGERVTIVDVAGVDHLFGWHADRDASLRDYGAGAFSPAIVQATMVLLRWNTGMSTGRA